MVPVCSPPGTCGPTTFSWWGRERAHLHKRFHCRLALTIRVFLSSLFCSLGTLVFHYIVLWAFRLAIFTCLLFKMNLQASWRLPAALLCYLGVGGMGLLNKYCLDSKLLRQSHKGVCRTLICYFPGGSLGMMCYYCCDAFYGKQKNWTRQIFLILGVDWGSHLSFVSDIWDVIEAIKHSKHSFNPYWGANCRDLTETKTI